MPVNLKVELKNNNQNIKKELANNHRIDQNMNNSTFIEEAKDIFKKLPSNIKQKYVLCRAICFRELMQEF